MNLLIKCKQCGHENPVGDLFCRQCGAEIDMTNLDPKRLVKPKKTGRMNHFIDVVSSLLVFFGLLFTVCLFIPSSSVEITPLDSANTALAEGAVEPISLALQGKSPPPKDANSKPLPPKTHILLEQKLAGSIFKSLFMKSDKYAKTSCSELVDGEANVTLVMTTRIYGFPFKIIVKGKLEPVGKNDLFNWQLAKNSSLAINYTQVGLIPLGIKSAPLLHKVFFPFMDDQEFKSTVSQIESIKVTKDKQLLSIYLVQPEGTKKTQ